MHLEGSSAEGSGSVAAPLIIYRSTLGRLAWVLGPLGLGVLGWGALLASRGHPDAWSALGLAVLFLVAAAVFLITRRRLVIEGHRWRLDRGLLYGSDGGRLADVAAVAIGPDPNAAPDEAGTWRVDLQVVGDRRVGVVDDLAADLARVEGETLALRLGRGLVSPEGTVAPAALRGRVAQRLAALDRAGDGAPAPVAPRGLAPSPPWHIAAPGRTAMGPALLWGAAVAGLIALHLGSLFLGAGPALLFSAVVLPLELLAAVALTRSLIRAFGRTEVRLQGDLLVLVRPLHREEVPLASVLALRPGPGRVDVLAVDAAHRVGVRLTPGEQRWMIQQLAREMSRSLREGPGRA